MPGARGGWNREQVLLLPDDGNRYELFDGELLVTPAPTLRRQLAVAWLHSAIAPWVRSRGLGRALTSPADLELGGNQVAQPDLFVLPAIPDDRSWGSTPDPSLVVEVLSPASARGDRLLKRRRYQAAGIPEYWVVDLDARVVERWRPGEVRPEIHDKDLVWDPVGQGEPLVLDLRALFLEACGPVA